VKYKADILVTTWMQANIFCEENFEETEKCAEMNTVPAFNYVTRVKLG
jgi:hypothetical protein